jgi:hypothetical protein
MVGKIPLILFVVWGTTAVVCAGENAAPLAIWAVDPQVKVFRDTQPAAPSNLAFHAARNEYESGQFALRSSQALKNLRVEISPLRQSDGKTAIPPENVTWNFVGFIPLTKNTHDSQSVIIRLAPCEIPDPLLENRTLDLPAATSQPVWVTVKVPQDAPAGVYRGEAVAISGDRRAVLPIELTVDPFTLPEERHLFVTNWFSLENIAKAHHVELWSEPFWTVLERYARNMAEHRQNVMMTPWTLIEIRKEGNGPLTFDYRRFDRFVELFQRAGVNGRIEISHVGGGKTGWGGEVALTNVTATDVKSGKPIVLGPDEGLKPLLADLERHLDQRGWLERSMIHVSDEAILESLDSYRKAAEFVRQAAPRLRRIDAIETSDCSGALEVWVPQLIHFDRWRQAYEARRKNNEFWYYICCNPYGNVYPNRFLDLPLSRIRVLHWINFSERLSGYLHWGLTCWEGDPFGVPSAGLPPGDTHVIYPGSQGPLSSIRWEIQRESIEDFEYLELLTAKTAALKKQLGKPAEWLNPRQRAEELARRVVPTLRTCEKEPARILSTHRAVADEIMALDQSPLLLVKTEPPDGSVVAEGPISIEVHGLTEPGATVRVNGQAIKVPADGAFIFRSGPNIRVEAERNGKKKTAVRDFAVQR